VVERDDFIAGPTKGEHDVGTKLSVRAEYRDPHSRTRLAVLHLMP
jgi:hypothetical protein